MKHKFTVSEIAKALGVTEDQVRAQLARNAMGLHLMSVKARNSKKPVNGYTEAQLTRMSRAAYRRSKERA